MKSIFLSSKEASRFLGITTKTLQRWDRDGVLRPEGRTPTNRRFYTESQLTKFLQLKNESKATRVIGYCRVSSAAQKPDLLNQEGVLRKFTGTNIEIISEVGGGLNFKRKKFLEIMDAIERFEVKQLVIAHKDRLTRFGFDFFEHYAKKHGCEILVLDNKAMSPEQEMVQDLMTIIHCFSSRLYGLRNYRKSLRKALGDESIQD